MVERTVGIVPAPELPATIAHAIKGKLEKDLHLFVDDQCKWVVEIEVDLLTGAAEDVEEILEETELLKKKNEWNYAISLTDLPIYNGKSIVLADANIKNCTAQVSLPAFGWRPTPKRVKKIMIQLVRELFCRQDDMNEVEMAQKGIGPLEQHHNDGILHKIREAFRFSFIRRLESPENTPSSSVRFVVFPKLNGLSRLLFGMTVANRPWGILPSFKGIVGIAFATGAYGLIFPTLWKLSITYEWYRFIGLMFTAILGMVTWIIFAHDLWERTNKENKNRLRWLYNSATILTLCTSVVLYYLVLFFLFLIAVTVFVPPDLYSSEAGEDVSPLSYLRLAWLVTSVATFAGAIGVGLENAERVRKSAYSYRQYTRYEEMKRIEEKQEQEKYGKEEK